jgi:hypothetical protein
MALPSQAPSNSGTHARQIRSAPAPRFLLSSFVFAVSSPRSLVLMTPASVPAGDPLYPELWRACAGPLVTVPRVGDLVFYFPQGHIEQVRLPLRLHLLPLEPWLAPFAADADLECSQVEASMNQVAGNPMRLYDLPSKLLCRVLNVELKVPSSSAPVFLPSLV